MNELKDKRYLVVDDFVDVETANELETFLTSRSIPYYFHTDSVSKDANMRQKPREDEEIYNSSSFVHSFILAGQSNSSLVETRQMKKFMHCLPKGDIIFRMKTNLTQSNPLNNEYKYGIPHIDSWDEHYVALYYVNDSDGDTILFEQDEKTIIDRITPKKGRCLFFRGDLPHSSSSPVKSNYRIVINTNLFYSNI